MSRKTKVAVPPDCSAPGKFQPLKNPAGTGKDVDSVSGGSGTFNATPSTAPPVGQYLYVTQKATPVTGATIELMSAAVAVSPVPPIDPVLTSDLSSGTITGTSQKTTPDYTKTDIYVCYQKIADPTTDCSKSPEDLKDPTGGTGTVKSVTGSSGSFNATPSTAPTAGQYVYVTQVVTLTDKTTKTTTSPPLVAGTTSSGIRFGARPDDGNTQITVVGDNTMQFSLYQFDPGYLTLRRVTDINAANKTKKDAKKAAIAAIKANDIANKSSKAESSAKSVKSQDTAKVAQVDAVQNINASTTAQVDAGLARDAASTAQIVATNTQAEADATSDNVPKCGPADFAHGIALQINTTGASGTNTTTTSTLATIAGATPNTFTLTQPLVGGTELCLVEFNKSGAAVQYSELTTVNDPFDYGRLSAHFTGGSVITNQQGASSSSTAAEYVNLEVDGAILRAGQRPCTALHGCNRIDPKSGLQPTANQGSPYQPGWQVFFNTQLTSFPVAATSTTTTVPTTGTTTTTNTLNLLTSQQGVIVQVGSFLPFRTRGWFKRSYAFEMGPLATASFATILNPSASSSSTNSTAATSVTTTAFSPTYNSWKVGGRITAGRYPPSSDYMPKPITIFDVSLGPNSNLPSYVCVASGGGKPSGAVTTCGTSGAYSTLTNVSRTLVPRLLISGSFSLPNFPLVLGLDANLAQYAVFKHSSFIDVANKPGNDIRVYIGVRLDFTNLERMLGLGSLTGVTKTATATTPKAATTPTSP